MKCADNVRKYAGKTPVFDTRSVLRLVGDPDYAYVLLNHLVRAGEIKRVTRGYYSVHEEPALLVYCMKPAYLGLQDAMSFHNLWEQETNPVIVTARRVRCGVRSVFGHNVIVHRICPRHFFGYDYYKYGEFLLPVSDVEKTFIDMVYFNEIRTDMIRGFKTKIDKKKLHEYLRKYDARFVQRALQLISW